MQVSLPAEGPADPPKQPNKGKDIEMKVDQLADDDYVLVSSHLIALFCPFSLLSQVP